MDREQQGFRAVYPVHSCEATFRCSVDVQPNKIHRCTDVGGIMSRRRSPHVLISLLITAIAAVGASRLMLGFVPSEQVRPFENPTEPAPAFAPKRASPPPITNLVAAAGAQPRSPSHEVLRDYESAFDLRTFVETAKRKPAQGGIFYALRALSECAEHRLPGRGAAPSISIDVSATDNQETAIAQLRAMQVLQHRCSGFTPDELSERARRDLRAHGEAAGDLLLLAERRFSESIAEMNSQMRREAARTVLSLQDPYLLEALGPKIMMGGSTSDSATYVLDGKRYHGAAAKEVELAWALIPCAFGARCDQPLATIEASLTCLRESRCPKNRFDAVWEPVQWDTTAHGRILQIHDRLREVIRSLEVDAFASADALQMNPSIKRRCPASDCSP